MRRRTAPLIALIVVAALAVTGCGPVNAGSGAIAAFTRHMTAVPRVIATDGSGSNTLPVVGSADVTVTIEDDASANEVADIVGRAAAFMRDYPYSITWGGTAQIGAFSFDFAKDDDINAATIELYHLVHTEDGVTGGLVTREGEGSLALVDLAAVTVNYRSSEGAAPGFALHGPAERRAALLAAGYVQRAEVLADRVDVVAGPYDEQQLAQLTADLEALVPDDSVVRVTQGS